MIIAMQTGTDFPSYPHSKIGSRGWFFAGNDLSALRDYVPNRCLIFDL